MGKTGTTRWLAWAGAWALAAAALLGFRAWLRLDVPLGPDPALWGLSASMLLRGDLPAAQPGYPLLTAAASAITGALPWRTGAWIAILATAAVPVVVARLARRLQLSWPMAVGAGAGSLLVPDVLAFGFLLQPDALATLAVLGTLAAGFAWQARPDGPRAALFLGAAAALALIREHGAVVLPMAALAIVSHRRPRLALALLGWGVAAGLLLLTTDLAGHLPGRMAQPLLESPFGAGRGPVPDYVKELGRGAAEPFRAAWTEGDVLGAWAVVLERLVARSGDNLLLLGLGAAGWGLAWGLRRGRVRLVALPGLAGPLVTLAPVLALLVVWSQRRHTSVLLPVVVLGLAAGGTALVRRWPATRAGLVLAAAIGLAVVGRELPSTFAGLRTAASHGHARVALAAWMDAQPGAWFLGGQHNEVNLHLVWPRHNPALPPPGTPLPETWSGADWRTLWVAPRGVMPPPFTEVHAEGGLAVFRLEAAPGAPRPCGEVVPVEGPLFTSEPVRGEARPSCEAPAWFADRPEPAEGAWSGQPWVPPER